MTAVTGRYDGEDSALRLAYAEALAKAKAPQDSLTLALYGEGRPAEVTAVAAVLGLDPEALWDHVEGIHGWESHNDGYEDAVWAAARCKDPGHHGQDCQAPHCPPSMYTDCEWPRCAPDSARDALDAQTLHDSPGADL